MERIEPGEDHALDERHGGERTRPKAPHAAWVAVGVALAAIGVAVYIGRGVIERSAEPAPVATTPATGPRQPPAPPAAPAERYPIAGVAREGAASEPLPAPGESDRYFQDLLAALVGNRAVAALFHADEIARRIVVTVDNLPRPRLAVRLLPVKPAAGAFVVAADGGAFATTAENDMRYAAYAAIAESLDTRALVAAYVRVYPLLQEEYRTLGYPSGHFNDRVVEAIDDLLAAPDVAAPIALVQPKVRYEFADPDLESRSAGQKIMMRIGGQNEARVKAKLREIRSALIGSAPGH